MHRILISGVLLALVGLAGPALAIALMPGPTEGPERGLVLVLAAPWSDGAATIIHDAGGVVVGPRDRWIAAFANAPDDDGMAGDAFADRLHAGGAWQVLDGTTLATLCGLDSR